MNKNIRTITGSDVNYFLADHLGSTNGLANSSGNLTSSASYDSFGNATGNLNTRYQFTGREYDSISKLHYYRARFYDGKLGRFISEDPIGFAGGDINLFGYVVNNPIGWKDPYKDLITEMMAETGESLKSLKIIDPPERLETDLCEREFEWRNVENREVKVLEQKKIFKKRKVHSPDGGDGFVMAAAPDFCFKISVTAAPISLGKTSRWTI